MQVEIDGTVKTPEVQLSGGRMYISGRSILEDSTVFYRPLAGLLEDYRKRCGPIKSIDLQFEYLNCSSKRAVVNLIGLLEKYYEEGNNFTINWYYYDDDESMRDTGHILKLLTQVPLNIIEVRTSREDISMT